MNSLTPVGHVPAAFHAAPGRELRRRCRRCSSSTHSLRPTPTKLKKKHKACILLWMGGGPPTIDIWDLKPGARPAASSSRSSTTGDVQICEHMPLMAKQMKHLSIVRSMSTREADHDRGRYYMHTGYVPNPTVIHPASARSSLTSWRPRRQSWRFRRSSSIGGGSEGPGLPGHGLRAVRRRLATADVRNADMTGDQRTGSTQRLAMLDVRRERTSSTRTAATSAEAHKDVSRRPST